MTKRVNLRAVAQFLTTIAYMQLEEDGRATVGQFK
jgi:hypothetical protein